MTAWLLGGLLLGFQPAAAYTPNDTFPDTSADTGTTGTGTGTATGGTATGGTATGTIPVDTGYETPSCSTCSTAAELAKDPGGTPCADGCATGPAGGGAGLAFLLLVTAAGRTRRRP